MNPALDGLTSTSLFQSSATPPKSASPSLFAASPSLFGGATTGFGGGTTGVGGGATGVGGGITGVGGGTTGVGGGTTGVGGGTTGFGGGTTSFGEGTTGFGGGLPAFSLGKENSKGEVPLTTAFQPWNPPSPNSLEGCGQSITFPHPFSDYSFEVSYFGMLANVSEANYPVLNRNFVLMTTALGTATGHLGFKSTRSSSCLY
jgi:hypothetical protein